MIKVGDTWPVWWWQPGGMQDGFYRARILEIQPYRGRYSESFSHTLRLSSETKSGWTEMTVKL